VKAGLPRLYPILDTGSLARRNCRVETAAEAMLAGGARILQLRHKEQFSRAVFREAECVAAMCRQAGVLFIVDDRSDIALMLGAGCHVGQDDLPPAAARRVIGAERILGYSTHNLEQLRAAAAEPVDYLAFGPVFATGSKPNPDPVVGTAGLRAAKKETGLPLVAIGGITRANAREALDAGADSLAVIGDLLAEPCDYRGLRTRMEEWQRLVSE
jgi:thiamine-phosphate pyrophosphorylase